METSLSMDEVLRKRYHEKLEHRETDLVKTLPPPRRANCLVLTVVTSIPPVAEGSSASGEYSHLAPQPILIVAPSFGACSSHTKMVEDSKDGIISDARRVIAKRKVILVMGETSNSAFNIRRSVQSRRTFTRLLNSISSTP